MVQTPPLRSLSEDDDDDDYSSYKHHHHQEISSHYSSSTDKGWCVSKRQDDAMSAWSNGDSIRIQQSAIGIGSPTPTPNTSTTHISLSSSLRRKLKYTKPIAIRSSSFESPTSTRRSFNASSSSSSGVTPIRAARRQSNSLDELTIDKLRFDTLELFGREKEQKLLKQALGISSTLKHLILIKGYSGTGKSALARSIEPSIVQSAKKQGGGGMLAEGKFDIQLRNVPFAGITAIGNAICSNLYSKQFEKATTSSSIPSSSEDHEDGKTTFDRVQQLLLDEMGSDLDVLTRLIPVLGEIVETQSVHHAPEDRNYDGIQLQRLESTSDPPHNNDSNEVTSEKKSKTNNTTNVYIGGKSLDSKHRFQNAFRRFLRVIANHFQPLVLILDDLQWADISSLDLMEVILTDRENDNLLMIGTYRSNEVDEHHILTRTLRELRLRSRSETFPYSTNGDSSNKDDASKTTTITATTDFAMQEVEIGNLDLDSVHQIVRHLLTDDDNENKQQTTDLAGLCYKRTHGNVFFLLHFLHLLHEGKLLNFNLGSFKWTWDVDDIEQKTQASANVVDLLESRLCDLPKLSQDVIQLASCLGTKFETSILLQVYRGFYEDNNNIMNNTVLDRDELHGVLESLVDGGYLESNNQKQHDPDYYSFSHDKVREAVSRLIPDNERRSFFYRVGELLVARLGKEDLETTLFVAVDLLNEGSSNNLQNIDYQKRICIADLNRLAGRKAISFPSFEATADFVARGLALLPTDVKSRWECHRELALELYTMGSKAEAFLGHSERVDLYSKEVISRQDLRIEDKLDVYNVWIDNLAYRGNMTEASSLGLELLSKFGCTFPKTKLGITVKLVKNILKFKGLLKGNKIEKLAAMPDDIDSTRRKLLVILDRVTTILYQCAKKELACLVTLRMMEWTIQYGLNDYSAVALATTGIIISGVYGDFEAGFTLAKYGLALAERSPMHQSRTLLCVHGFAAHFFVPLRENLNPFLRGYELGVRLGDTESAGWHMIAFMQLRFITSFPLELAVSDLEAFTTQMKDFNRIHCHEYGMFYWEVFDNLLGRTESHTMVLGGNRMSIEALDRLCKGSRMFGALRNTFQGALYCIYGEYERCAHISLTHGPDEYFKISVGRAVSYLEALTKGLSCYAAARITGQRKYRRHAEAIHRRVKQWVAKGNPNVRHYAMIFDAEKAALRGDNKTAIQMYERVIIMSARGGMLMEAGLSSERLADLFLENHQAEDAKFRLEQGCRYWNSLGAHRKVWLLQERHHELLRPKPSEITMQVE